MERPATTEPAAPHGPRLRLVGINDVYKLENLPRLRTFLNERLARADADLTLTTIAGDFVAPSLLSSIDKGYGMVDCLDAVPITLACFGNHEQDVPYEALLARARQFRGVWLNTNLPGFGVPLPESRVIEVRARGGRAVRVGFVGVVTEDPSLYPRGSFGGLTPLPANATALAVGRRLVDDEGCACVVALTHQALDRDEALARAQGTPPVALILGGHEHEPHVAQVGTSWIVKAGQDATYAAVVDLAWPEAPPEEGPDLPAVTVRLEPLAEVPSDPALLALVATHDRVTEALGGEVLVHLKEGEPLSSVGTRVRQTSVGAMLASKVRDVLGVDACIINGGGIRGSRDYSGAFTYGDLENELPFANEVVEATMPGRVLREAIAGSRARAPRPAPGFLQVDDGVTVTDDHAVIAVRGEPFDDEREYRVATVRTLFEGMDHLDALVEFARAHPERIPAHDAGRELKLIVIDGFARELWRRLGAFEDLDSDGDLRISSEELRDALLRVTRLKPSGLLLDAIERAHDLDGDGAISRDESLRGPWKK